jgi:hypothetical protein
MGEARTGSGRRSVPGRDLTTTGQLLLSPHTSLSFFPFHFLLYISPKSVSRRFSET